MPVAHVNGVDLYYEIGGDGEAVVHVHGGFPSLASTLHDCSRWSWSWENDLASAFRFLAYDRRWCYRSSMLTGGSDLEELAPDLAGLLDALRVPSAHVIGSSAGGPIGVTFAAHYP